MESKKILIVDDDADIRIGLDARLRASGFETVFAEDAVEAMTVARKHQPDLILLDLSLPAGDGLFVLELLKSHTSLACTPVIILTAHDPDHSEQRALAAGASAFFQKPAANEELLEAIATALP